MKPIANRFRAGGIAAMVAVLALFPLLAGFFEQNQHEFYMQQLSWIMIFGLFAMSLDLLVGIVGLVSLGHAAFFGLGGYMLVLLSPEYETASLLTVLPGALAGVALAALVVGALVLRTRGVYFIMVTLAIGQMFFYLFNDSSIAGGSDGVYLFFKPILEVGGVLLLDLGDRNQFYYAVLVSLFASYLLLRVIMAAPFGKVIRGIGVNENRTQGLGYNVYAYKLVTFVISATLAGLAGFLAAAQYGFMNPAMLGWHNSGTALVTVILGGMGTLVGPILGAFVIEFLRHGLESLTEHWMLLFGGLIILMVLVLPRGLAGLGSLFASKRPEPEVATSRAAPSDVEAKIKEAEA